MSLRLRPIRHFIMFPQQSIQLSQRSIDGFLPKRVLVGGNGGFEL
jgi:hypothetical protein